MAGLFSGLTVEVRGGYELEKKKVKVSFLQLEFTSNETILLLRSKVLLMRHH